MNKELKNFKGTKGHWHYRKNGVDLIKVLNKKGKKVCDISCNLNNRIDSTNIANAHLISKAPELLEALEMVYRQFKDLQDSLYGKNINVVGWHLNGDHESFDSFIEDNDEGGLDKAGNLIDELLK